VASLVSAFGIPHNPHFPSWVRQGAPIAPEIERMYAPLAEAFAAGRPDALVYITSDHYNLFWESVPVFAIGVADSARGASDYPELERELPIATELARHIHRQLLDAEYDVAMLQELEFDHTVIAPLHFLTPDVDVPIVPVYVNAFLRPLPSAQRCLGLGRALRAAIESAPGHQRVAIAASGSFSLEIGGPRISEDSHVGVPDPAWLARVLELIGAADVERLVAEASDEQLWAAGNAGGELLDWIVMLGAFDPRPPGYLDVQAQFGHGFASWALEPEAVRE
jgi:aromatic ring-opening dioxygenase catalytic subunit (LigB family)